MNKSKKNYCLLIVLFTIITILAACNKNAKRYNVKTTINPELIGEWSSSTGCFLELAKQNESLVLINYHDNEHHSLQNIILKFTPYSIETKLTNAKSTDPTFSAKHIDGAIIIDNYCNSPLRKFATE
jgi:hypothetical protein